MEPKYAIEVSNLTKRYEDLVAVDHIDFTVNQKEIFGFLGPNGAGKTTTIRMLTGISIPTEGTAKIMGYDIQRQTIEAKERIGIVPDISNVYNELSAWDNLIFTGKLYDMPKDFREKHAEELLKMFGLYERRNEKVQGFSRGMKKRICIAMALMNKANIIFLDEPTSGLDVQSVLIIRDLIRKQNQDGQTIFITTHNIEEASQMCDRVAIINHGKIAAIDTPEKLKRTVESLQSVEVAFEATAPDALKKLGDLPEVSEAVKEGDKFKLFTSNPSIVLASVWNYTQSNNLKLITINTIGPSLEDVFVKLTGIRPATESGDGTRMGQGRGQGMGQGRGRQ
ncbi:MAG: ATP-binding cassette domain-containing protein [Candidatus Bathyarchaeota archaeon]